MRKHLFKTAFIALSVLGVNGVLQAQQGQLSGSISDTVNKVPLANATVTLTSLQTTSLTKSLQTDAKGSFSFANLTDGYYTLTVTYTGFRGYRKDSLLVNGAIAPLTIVLQTQSNDLKAVTVSGKKPFIVQEADKLVLNVESSPVAAGSTSWEVLLKAPGLVERDGSLQFRGKPVNVLINGRPSNLSGEDLKNMLAAMPANGIEKIELLSNPSSKYDAQGGAVINIKLAKIKGLGTNGILTAGAGTGKYFRYNSGLSLNHRTKKANIYGSYDYMHYDQYYKSWSYRDLNSSSSITDESYERRNRNNNSYKFGLDYDLNKRNSLGLLIKGFLNERNRMVDNSVRLSTLNGPGDSLSTVRTDGYAKITSPSLNVYFRSILDKAGSELNINADHFRYHKDWNDDFTTRYFDEKGLEYASPYLLRDNSPAQITVTSASADYTRPSKIVKLEAGLKATHTVTDNNVRWEAQENAGWKPDPGRTNHFVYTEDIYAAYFILSMTFGKVDLKTGIRAEQTHSNGELKTSETYTENDYLNFFPSASVNYNINDKNSLSLSYRKTIRRFGYDIVNPFIIYYNQYSYYQGNPAIRPSLSHNFELSHAFNNKLFTSLSYLRVVHALAEVFKRDDNGAQVRTYENLASANQVGLDISYMESLLKGKWTSTNSVGAIYAKYDDAVSLQQGNATKALYLTSNNMFKLKDNWSVELAGNFFTPMVYGVYKFRSQGSMDAGVSKSWATNKWKVGLSITDVFNTLKQNYDVHSYSIATQYRSKTESRFARINLTYRFGDKSVKASKSRKTGVEEARDRTGSN